MKKLLNNISHVNKQIKTNKLFWDEISNDAELINFFNKNKFTLVSIPKDMFGLLIFYKVGIIDNSLDLYKDLDDIKSVIESEYENKLGLLYENINFNVETYAKLHVKVEKTKLIPYNDTFFNLVNGNKLDSDKINSLISTNLIDNEQVNKVLNQNEIYVYTIQYSFKDVGNLLKARKQLLNFVKILSILVLVFTLIMIAYQYI